jgi:DNA-binding response OmpR family regulator
MKTILIVDDEPAARYGLRRALESKYRIAESDSAETARAAIETEKPDLVLLDVVLPGVDGVSFLKSLRDQGNEVPVLMVSRGTRPKCGRRFAGVRGRLAGEGV